MHCLVIKVGMCLSGKWDFSGTREQVLVGRPSWRHHWTRVWHHDLNQGLLVMCSETVGLRTIPVWDQKKSVLVLQVWCCVEKHGLVTLIVIMILKDTATFQILFIVSLYSVLGTSLLWRSTVAFTHLKVKSAKCLCLLLAVLVLLSWS